MTQDEKAAAELRAAATATVNHIPYQPVYHWNDNPELRAARIAGNVSKIHELFAAGLADADDATTELEDSLDDPIMLRCLLELGAYVHTVDMTRVDSGEALKVLAEFGYDIRSQGHLILQSVCQRNVLICDAKPCSGTSQMIEKLSTGCSIKASTSPRPLLDELPRGSTCT